jgi:hypothetical protein
LARCNGTPKSIVPENAPGGERSVRQPDGGAIALAASARSGRPIGSAGGADKARPPVGFGIVIDPSRDSAKESR